MGRDGGVHLDGEGWTVPLGWQVWRVLFGQGRVEGFTWMGGVEGFIQMGRGEGCH